MPDTTFETALILIQCSWAKGETPSAYSKAMEPFFFPSQHT